MNCTKKKNYEKKFWEQEGIREPENRTGQIYRKIVCKTINSIFEFRINWKKILHNWMWFERDIGINSLCTCNSGGRLKYW